MPAGHHDFLFLVVELPGDCRVVIQHVVQFDHDFHVLSSVEVQFVALGDGCGGWGWRGDGGCLVGSCLIRSCLVGSCFIVDGFIGSCLVGDGLVRGGLVGAFFGICGRDL